MHLRGVEICWFGAIPRTMGVRMRRHDGSSTGRARHGGVARRGLAPFGRLDDSPRVAAMVAAVLATVLTVLATLLAAAQQPGRCRAGASSPSRRSDTVGYPYVDLVLGGVPGLGSASHRPSTSPSPASRCAPPPAGTSRRPTRSRWSWTPRRRPWPRPKGWSPSSSRRRRPHCRSPSPRPRACTVGPGVNRDTLMAALAKQAPGTPSTVADGVRTATAKGVQHILVVTTCASPAPAQAPVGIVLDVLGIGPACTGAWQTYVNGGLGTFTAATNFDDRAGGPRRHRRSLAVLGRGRDPGPDSRPARAERRWGPDHGRPTGCPDDRADVHLARAGGRGRALRDGPHGPGRRPGALRPGRPAARHPVAPSPPGAAPGLRRAGRRSPPRSRADIATHVPADQTIDQRIDELLHEPAG